MVAVGRSVPDLVGLAVAALVVVALVAWRLRRSPEDHHDPHHDEAPVPDRERT